MVEAKKNVMLFMAKVDRGGIESLYLNLIPLLSNRYAFHVVYFLDGQCELAKDYLDMGCMLYRISCNRYRHPIRFVNLIRSYIRSNAIEIVHSNVGYSTAFCLIAAYLEGVPIRIAHSHGSEFGDAANILNEMFGYLCKLACRLLATSRVNVGEASRKALFFEKDRSVYVPNGIDLKRFTFNPLDRQRVRRKLNISEGTLVATCVARLEAEKNHDFALQVVSDIKNLGGDIKFVIVGTGSLEGRLRDKATELGIENEVVFVGPTNEPEAYYSAADCLLMPSLHEGLSLSMIEAQANGLRCYTSTGVDSAVAVTERISFLPLSNGSEFWARQIMMGPPRSTVRDIDKAFSSFDCRRTADLIDGLYRGRLG